MKSPFINERRRRTHLTLSVVIMVVLGTGICCPLRSQSAVWQPLGATSGSIYYNGGNVGVGTANPIRSLDVRSALFIGNTDWTGATTGSGVVLGLGSPSGNTYTAIQAYTAGAAGAGNLILNGSAGNVGIGTANPTASLDVAGTSITALRVNGTAGNPSSNNTQLRFAGGTHGDLWALGTDIAANNGSKDFHFYDFASGVRLTIQSATGNVGIGTTSPAHELQVVGTIGAKEVIVSSTGADYVFHPNYRLQSLSEVASYIEKHGHLPDIPPAADTLTKGISLGEMQTKLLAKVEELTLHMIEAEIRNSRLERANQELRDRVARLETSAAKERG